MKLSDIALCICAGLVLGGLLLLGLLLSGQAVWP